MGKRGKQTEQGTVEDAQYFRKFGMSQRLWGWNLSAADLPMFREAADDDKQVPAELVIKREMRKNLEKSLEISGKCSALGDERSSRYSRRAAAESISSFRQCIQPFLDGITNRLTRIEEHLQALSSKGQTPSLAGDIIVIEGDNLRLLKLNLAAVQSLAFSEAFKVFLEEVQQAREHPDLMDKVVVPFVAPRTEEASDNMEGV